MHRTPLVGRADPDSIATRQEFAAALTAVRESAGLTVREVARAARLSSSTVGGYFSGRHLPPLRPDGGIRVVVRACGITAPDELEAWHRALVRVRRGPGPRPGALPAPYPGLRAFGPDDAALFHGRQADADHVLARLGDRSPDGGGIVVLLGRAGSGKSSLVGAGVVPALRSLGRPVLMLSPGADPLRDLADALAPLTGAGPAATADNLQTNPSALRALVPRAAPGPSADRRPVVIVDQFESALELVDSDPHRRQAFVAALASLARPEPLGGSPATVLVVLRTEAVPEVARFADLAAALQSPDGDAGPGHARAVHLASMDDDALRTAVLEPARRAGADVDPELVEAVLSDVAELERQGAAALPRLSHALLATWRRDRRGRLTLADYRETGGVLGSVDLAAEAVYRSLSDDARAALPGLLFARPPGSAVRLGTAPTPVTPVAPASPASPAARAALRAFAEAGLLPHGNAGPDQHPAALPPSGLLQGWSRAQRWHQGEPATDPAPLAVQPVIAVHPMAPVPAPAAHGTGAATAPARRRWWPPWRRRG